MASVLVAISDLMFASKVSATARALDVGYQRASRKAPLVEEVARTDARRVLIDLAGVPNALEAVAAVHAKHPAVEIVGYCSHTDADLMGRARALGCSRVVSQSELTALLAELLRLP